MNPWYWFLMALGLAFLAGAGLSEKARLRIGLFVLSSLCFAVAAFMALPEVHVS